jgi:hypothetical protein
VRPFAFDRSWTFPVSPEELWRVLSVTDDYRKWWRWLTRFESDGLVEGATADCVVQAPLPYSLRFRVQILEVEPARLVRTQVTGDLDGPAQLEISPHAEGAQARLVWEVDLRSPLLRPMARWARPLMHWGHDWVVETGVRHFRRRAFAVV